MSMIELGADGRFIRARSARDAVTGPPARVQALGVFLASEDPGRLTAWYRALGVPLGDEAYGFVGGDGAPGSGSIFSIMPASTPLPAAQAGAIAEEPYGQRRGTLDLRVDGLEKTVAGLRSRGTKVAGPKDAG